LNLLAAAWSVSAYRFAASARTFAVSLRLDSVLHRTEATVSCSETHDVYTGPSVSPKWSGRRMTSVTEFAMVLNLVSASA
jgi:hypothetical protein